MSTECYSLSRHHHRLEPMAKTPFVRTHSSSFEDDEGEEEEEEEEEEEQREGEHEEEKHIQMCKKTPMAPQLQQSQSKQQMQPKPNSMAVVNKMSQNVYTDQNQTPPKGKTNMKKSFLRNAILAEKNFCGKMSQKKSEQLF